MNRTEGALDSDNYLSTAGWLNPWMVLCLGFYIHIFYIRRNQGCD